MEWNKETSGILRGGRGKFFDEEAMKKGEMVILEWRRWRDGG